MRKIRAFTVGILLAMALHTSAQTWPDPADRYVTDDRRLATGAGLVGGGDLSTDRTFAVDFSLVVTNGVRLSRFVNDIGLGGGVVTNTVLVSNVTIIVSNVVTTIYSNITTTAGASNGVVSLSFAEGSFPITETTTQEVSLGTVSLGSNGFSQVVIHAEVYLAVDSGVNPVFTVVKAQVNGVDQASPRGPFNLNGKMHTEVSLTTATAGGQTSNVVVDVRVASDNNNGSPNIRARLDAIWLEGVP